MKTDIDFIKESYKNYNSVNNTEESVKREINTCIDMGLFEEFVMGWRACEGHYSKDTQG